MTTNDFAFLLGAALLLALGLSFAIAGLLTGPSRTPPLPLARVIRRADPDARLHLAIGSLGSDRNPPPHWQDRVIAAVGRPTAWRRYRIALWIGIAVAAAVAVLVGVAS